MCSKMMGPVLEVQCNYQTGGIKIQFFGFFELIKKLGS